MTLNGVMAVTLRYFSDFGKPAFQRNRVDLWRNSCTSVLYFVVRVYERCRRKESSRSLSHLLMSFLLKLSSSEHTTLTTLRPAGADGIRTVLHGFIKLWDITSLGSVQVVGFFDNRHTPLCRRRTNGSVKISGR